ncbi:MAG TPA: hypothetical protein DEP08_01840 [Candidatus Jacksonbacteria bacterium]|nr:hypothetical protein [Candidatus Jacksonbacteria bacterium]
MSENKKYSVTVGIPAYNEETNIGHLISSILNQKGDNFVLSEIIVISDASKDRTAEIVKSIPDNRIVFSENKERIGQALNQNKILERFTGDILVILNADVLPGNEYYIQKMVAPFYLSKNLGIVSSRIVPMPAGTFFESVINYSVQMKEDMAKKINSGDNIYLCHGRGRAFSNEFTKQFKWGSAVSEDAYSYLMCKKLGFGFAYARDAEILYRSPQNFKDHMRQSIRFFKGQKNLAGSVSASNVAREHKIPLRIVLASSVKYFFKNPFLFTAYVVVLISAKILSLRGKEANVKWDSATSSKTLIK